MTDVFTTRLENLEPKEENNFFCSPQGYEFQEKEIKGEGEK